MAPRRPRNDDDAPDDDVLVRATREIREHDQPRRIFDPKNTFIPLGLVVIAAGVIWSLAVALSNYNNRLSKLEDRINLINRRVVYTHEWRAWAEVMRITNGGKTTVPDPKDYTSDRSE